MDWAEEREEVGVLKTTAISSLRENRVSNVSEIKLWDQDDSLVTDFAVAKPEVGVRRSWNTEIKFSEVDSRFASSSKSVLLSGTDPVSCSKKNCQS